VLTGLGIDSLHRAQHFGGEEEVVDRDDVRQQGDAGQMIDAGVEEDVLQHVLAQRRLLHHLGEATVAAPMERHCSSAMRDDQLQRGEILEQISLQQLHERGGVRVEVVRAGVVEAGVARRGYVDHRRHFQLAELLVERIPVPVRQRWIPPPTAGGIGV
jgi:hypothetical protein